MPMKIVLIYNSRCAQCLPYVQFVQFCVDKINIGFECYDVNADIFDSIHHIVNSRISIDKTINQLPLLLVYDSSGPKHAIVGTYSEEEFISKLKDIFL